MSRVRLLDDAGIAELLLSARRIAVVGASSNPMRPSHGVFRTLVAAGYVKSSNEAFTAWRRRLRAGQ